MTARNELDRHYGVEIILTLAVLIGLGAFAYKAPKTLALLAVGALAFVGHMVWKIDKADDTMLAALRIDSTAARACSSRNYGFIKASTLGDSITACQQALIDHPPQRPELSPWDVGAVRCPYFDSYLTKSDCARHSLFARRLATERHQAYVTEALVKEYVKTHPVPSTH